MGKIDFEILVDDLLAECEPGSQLFGNERLLSLVNDFEDKAWRTNRFIEFVFDNLSQSCLSKKERDALADRSYTALRRGAANLRLIDKDADTEGSELAEILLYGILRKHYDALPVVPKIFYKQNTKDNAKGADSVHLVIKGDAFTIWFGECKFYNSIEDTRLNKIITSVKASLSTEKLKKENAIITNVSDLQDIEMDKSLRDRILATLSEDRSMDEIKPLLHIPILILHECEKTAKCEALTNIYKKEIEDHHRERAKKYFAKQLKQVKDISLFEKVTFHLILMPVPNKKRIVELFLDKAKQLRNS